VNTVMVSFNATMGKMTEMSQRIKKPRSRTTW